MITLVAILAALFLLAACGPGAPQASPTVESVPTAAGALPETCKVPQGATLATLEIRRDKLQREIARATGQAARKAQEQLLEVLFQMDCLQTSQPPPAGRGYARRGAAPREHVGGGGACRGGHGGRGSGEARLADVVDRFWSNRRYGRALSFSNGTFCTPYDCQSR